MMLFSIPKRTCLQIFGKHFIPRVDSTTAELLSKFWVDQPGLDISGSLEEEGARKKNENCKVGYDTELDKKF